MIRKVLQLAAIAALVSLPLHAMAQDGDGDGGGEMGMDSGSDSIAKQAPELRGPPPIKRKDFDKAVEKLFHSDDPNHDGMITLAEFNAQVGARRDQVVQQRFNRIDTNHDGSISHAEFFAWQRSLGTVSLGSDSAAGSADQNVPAVLPIDIGHSIKDLEIARILQPITADVIVAANTNYDAGMSLSEFEAYEGKIFEKADTNQDHFLTMEEMRSAGLLKPHRGHRPG